MQEQDVAQYNSQSQSDRFAMPNTPAGLGGWWLGWVAVVAGAVVALSAGVGASRPEGSHIGRAAAVPSTTSSTSMPVVQLDRVVITPSPEQWAQLQARGRARPVPAPAP